MPGHACCRPPGNPVGIRHVIERGHLLSRLGKKRQRLYSHGEHGVLPPDLAGGRPQDHIAGPADGCGKNLILFRIPSRFDKEDIKGYNRSPGLSQLLHQFGVKAAGPGPRLTDLLKRGLINGHHHDIRWNFAPTMGGYQVIVPSKGGILADPGQRQAKKNNNRQDKTPKSDQPPFPSHCAHCKTLPFTPYSLTLPCPHSYHSSFSRKGVAEKGSDPFFFGTKNKSVPISTSTIYHGIISSFECPTTGVVVPSAQYPTGVVNSALQLQPSGPREKNFRYRALALVNSISESSPTAPGSQIASEHPQT